MHPILKRKDFVEIAGKGRKFVTPTVVVQRHVCSHEGVKGPGVGYTVTKKQGNAVVRNRIKRRLREAFKYKYQQLGVDADDYVLIGRAEAADCPYPQLLADLEKALTRLQPKSREYR